MGKHWKKGTASPWGVIEIPCRFAVCDIALKSGEEGSVSVGEKVRE
jgi:hypothetical protein